MLSLVAVQFALMAVAITAHLFTIDSVPRGMYLDECSIGYNARLIATKGYDEHHVRFPLFFKAFGEYKNPLYVYLMALVFKVFGFSLWTTRSTSFVCWLLGTASFYALGRRIWRDDWVRLYLLACLSFTPWIFSLSRVCFEVIVLFPLLGLYLYASYRAFEEGSLRWAAAAGVAIGISVYAYSTFRLLAPLQVGATLLCYVRRSSWRHAAVFAGCAALAAIPFMIYVVTNGQNLTIRFEGITYLNDAKLSWLEKAELFVRNYAGYFGREFLISAGDPNRRHHTGYGGELLLPTVLALALAVLARLEQRTLFRDRFVLLLLCGMLLAPLSAAVTRDEYHSLRTFSLGCFAVFLSVYGADWVRRRLGQFWAVALLGATLFNGGWYMHNYFSSFPGTSWVFFDSYGFSAALTRAASEVRGNGRILVSDAGTNRYIIASYHKGLLGKRHPPVRAGERGDMREGDVLVFADAGANFPHLRAGLPEGSKYSVQRFDQLDAIKAQP